AQSAAAGCVCATQRTRVPAAQAADTCGMRYRGVRRGRAKSDSRAWRDQVQATAPQRATSSLRCAHKARPRERPQLILQDVAAKQQKTCAPAQSQTIAEA